MFFSQLNLQNFFLLYSTEGVALSLRCHIFQHCPRLFGYVVLFCVIVFTPTLVRADGIFQTPDGENFIRQTFTTENGLPQNTAVAVVQTRDDYIWVATFGGLVRYDGIKFTIFTTANTPELIDNRIASLYEDPHGVLWIGSENGVLIKYKNGVFTLIRKSVGSATDRVISRMFMDGNDLLWFRNANHLNTYNTETGEFTEIDNGVFEKAGAKSGDVGSVKAFELDAENNLWIASDRGLIQFRENKFTLFDKTDGLPDDLIRFVKATPDGNLFIATDYGAGFFKNGKFTALVEKQTNAFPFPDFRNPEKFTFYTLNGKLYRLADGELLSYQLSQDKQEKTILADNEGNLWVGKNLELAVYKPRYVKVFWKPLAGQTGEGISRIIEDRQGAVFLVDGQQIMRWKKGLFETVMTVPKNSPAYKNEPYLKATAARDAAGDIWVGRRDGLFKFENDSFTKIETGSADADKFLTGTLFIARDGKIWSAGLESGLRMLQNGETKVYTTADGLIDNTVNCLFEDKKGVLWIGTRSGMSRLENGAFTNFTTDNGLTNNYVRDFYEDADETLWIATYGGGILRYRDGNFVSITTKNGLPENIASRILVDDFDNFWILGNQGVYSVSRAALNDFADGSSRIVYCAVYGIKDGMKNSEGNGGDQPSGWKTSDGRLWFPMVEGGIIITPPKTKSLAPPVYIEDVLLNRKSLNSSKEIVINPDESSLEINYTAINFTQPEQIKFQYKLEGYDTDWQEAGTRRTAYYQYLTPGTYNFTVRAVTADGVWSENRANLKIRVKSGIIVHRREDGTAFFTIDFPFYLYWWLYLLLSVLSISAIVFAYQKRLEILERRRAEQQKFFRRLIYAHESERRRIAAELHDSVGQSLAIIKNAAFYDATKPFNAETGKRQLQQIFEQSKQTISEVREITYNLRPYMLERFGITEAVKSLIEKIALSDTLDVYLKIDPIDRLFSNEEEISIYRIIQESLNNALKHSDASEVNVEIKRFNNFITIKIQDDGRGFDPKVLRERNGRAGFGLVGIAERIQMLGGTYSIESKLSIGTTIYVNVKIRGIEKGEN